MSKIQWRAWLVWFGRLMSILLAVVVVNKGVSLPAVLKPVVDMYIQTETPYKFSYTVQDLKLCRMDMVSV